MEKKAYIPNFIKHVNYTDIKKQSYVFLCFESMKHICTSLNTICDYKKDKFEISDDDSQIYERNYVISLAVELAKQQERLDTVGLKGIINGEVAKKLSLARSSIRDEYVKIRKNIDKKYKGKKTEIFVLPDFLIHETHSYEENKLDEEHQHLAMEVKTKKIKRKEFFLLDMLKLNYYLETLKFANVVYMLVGTTIKTIDDYIGNYLKDVGYKCSKANDHLFFFIQEKLNSEPQIFKLK